jgi:quercetin dioxygenase-like cupin family protein
MHDTTRSEVTVVEPVPLMPAVLTSGAGGAYALATLVLPPYHPGMPQHQHPAHVEGCYVIRGTLAVTHDSRTITLTQGASILIAPGVAHTIWNPTAAAVTLLLIYQPGGSTDEIVALAAGSMGMQEPLLDVQPYGTMLQGEKVV